MKNQLYLQARNAPTSTSIRRGGSCPSRPCRSDVLVPASCYRSRDLSCLIGTVGPRPTARTNDINSAPRLSGDSNCPHGNLKEASQSLQFVPLTDLPGNLREISRTVSAAAAQRRSCGEATLTAVPSICHRLSLGEHGNNWVSSPDPHLRGLSHPSSTFLHKQREAHGACTIQYEPSTSTRRQFPSLLIFLHALAMAAAGPAQRLRAIFTNLTAMPGAPSPMPRHRPRYSRLSTASCSIAISCGIGRSKLSYLFLCTAAPALHPVSLMWHRAIVQETRLPRLERWPIMESSLLQIRREALSVIGALGQHATTFTEYDPATME
jgi:hypothetical protein